MVRVTLTVIRWLWEILRGFPDTTLRYAIGPAVFGFIRICRPGIHLYFCLKRSLCRRNRNRRSGNRSSLCRNGFLKRKGDYTIRVWYRCVIESVYPQLRLWLTKKSPKSVAYKACQYRERIRMHARTMMKNQTTLAATEAYERGAFGRLEGPTFEMLVDKARAKGYTGDGIYVSIIEGFRHFGKAFERERRDSK